MYRQMSSEQRRQVLQQQSEWCRSVNPINTQNCCISQGEWREKLLKQCCCNHEDLRRQRCNPHCEDLRDTVQEEPLVVKAEVVRGQAICLPA